MTDLPQGSSRTHGRFQKIPSSQAFSPCGRSCFFLRCIGATGRRQFQRRGLAAGQAWAREAPQASRRGEVSAAAASFS